MSRPLGICMVIVSNVLPRVSSIVTTGPGFWISLIISKRLKRSGHPGHLILNQSSGMVKQSLRLKLIVPLSLRQRDCACTGLYERLATEVANNIEVIRPITNKRFINLI